MKLLTVETITKIFDENLNIQDQNTVIRYLLEPTEGKALRDKRTKKIILGSIQIGPKSHKDFYEEIDIPEYLKD
jgi:hypothetical protein